MNNLVVNLHLLEQCNYRCVHCFSHFNSSEALSFSGWTKIVDNIMGSAFIDRINLAGGEPLLLPWIQKLAGYIRKKGAEVSIITNGSLLKEKMLQQGIVSMIGVSIDSFNEETLFKIGRCTANGTVLEDKQYHKICALVKKNGIDLKINTVVTRLNLEDDFSPVKAIAPKRWKILRMQTFKSCNFDNSPLAISDEEFATFCRKQTAHGIPFISENTMRSTYIFVDPTGNLLDNADGNYSSIGNLRDEDFSQCIARLPLNRKLYESRYV
ncbi:MAG: viperin family antiviral radical SAM protein [Treponema sp.]|nr:viperin family antiviral radical SAM protein [Treponema sp.]